jgi:hypothetical protein
LFAKEGFELTAFEFMPQHWALLLIDTVKREHVLGRIDRMRLNGIWAVFGWCLTTQRWHAMPLDRPPQKPALTLTDRRRPDDTADVGGWRTP